MKAIETIYNGYRFRSRLEARWAVFFDVLGIKYQYELEGYETKITGEDGNIEKTIRYLPDFYLPDTRTFVEVKGNLSKNDAYKMEQILDYGSPLPHFDGSYDFKENLYVGYRPGLLILGEIPCVDWGIVLHKFVTHRKGLWFGHAVFFNSRWLHLVNETSANLINLFSGDNEIEEPLSNGNFEPETKYLSTKLANAKVVQAYKTARQARFEFGENKKINAA